MELLQVAGTALLSLAALLLLTKGMGSKQVSQMTMFDYIVGITIGSIAAELATGMETLLRPLLAMGIYALSAVIISFGTNRSLFLRRIFTGKPLVLLENGKIYRENLKKARLDLSEFLTYCRIEGYFDLNSLQTAVFEHNGKVSFLPKASARPATPEDFALQPQQTYLQLPVILDGEILPHNLKRAGKDEVWLRRALQKAGYHGAREVLLALCDSHSGEMTAFAMDSRVP